MKRFATIACAAVMALSLGLLSGCSAVNSVLGQVDAPSTPDRTLEPTTSATAREGILTVGVDYNYPPFAGTDSEGTVVGIDVDIASALAEQLGCKVEFVDVAVDEADTALAAGTIDIAMNVGAKDYAPSAVTTVGPYLTDAAALFGVSTDGQPVQVQTENLGASRIAAQTDSVSAYQVSTTYGADALVNSLTLADAFTSLSNGDVNYTAADAIVGSYIIQDYPSVVLIQSIGNSNGIFVGVSATNQQLAADISQALAAIQGNGVLNTVVSKWIGAPLDLPATADLQSFVAGAVAAPVEEAVEPAAEEAPAEEEAAE